MPAKGAKPPTPAKGAKPGSPVARHAPAATGIGDRAASVGRAAKEQVFEGARLAGNAARNAAAAAGVPPNVTDLANATTSTLLDLAHDMAGLALRTAAQIGEALVEAAGELEHALGHPAGDALGANSDIAPVGVRDATTVPPRAALVLPDTSPGRSGSAAFTVSNPGQDTLDALSLRCAGLVGPGDVRIAASHVTFAPVTFELLPGTQVTATCTVAVPARAKRAGYIGLIEVAGLSGAELLVSLDVV
jgi:hypothetical protein